LLRIATSRRGRRDLAKRIGINEHRLLVWVKQADLSRIKGVDVVYSSLLVAAGVATVPDLARRNPAHLHRKLAHVSQGTDLVRKTPGRNQVQSWVSQAKLLPRVITY
jgi:predicted flap endonuclease-1-like 5' DNA nuclease